MSSFGNLKGTPMKEAFTCTRICTDKDIAAKRYFCEEGDKGKNAQHLCTKEDADNGYSGCTANDVGKKINIVNYAGMGEYDYQCKEYKGNPQQDAAINNQVSINETCEDKYPKPTQGSLSDKEYDELVFNVKQDKIECILKRTGRQVEVTQLEGQELADQWAEFNSKFKELRNQRNEAVETATEMRTLAKPAVQKLQSRIGELEAVLRERGIQVPE